MISQVIFADYEIFLKNQEYNHKDNLSRTIPSLKSIRFQIIIFFLSEFKMRKKPYLEKIFAK